MQVTITPHKLKGTVRIPSSKSVAHRMLIAAALADGTSIIDGVDYSQDITATIYALRSLGADIKTEGNRVTVTGITDAAPLASINCHESGSTLRFLIPVAAALGTESIFMGEGRLPERPVTAYIRELPKKGINFEYGNGMPFRISGKLKSGVYNLEGNVSSQYVTGLLFALPLLIGNSEIIMTTKLQSKPYVDMTIGCLKKFGIKIEETDIGYKIKGGQRYKPADITIEGDYSQAAFFAVANALGCDIKLENLDPDSMQGDKIIIDITKKWKENAENNKPNYLDINAENIPDIVPILAVLAVSGTQKSVIRGAERLKLKESNRLESVSDMLMTLGGKVTVTDDGLEIDPVKTLHGGITDSFGDHRIAMCAAIAAIMADDDVTILRADSVKKSYPQFFDDYRKLGGIVNGFSME